MSRSTNNVLEAKSLRLVRINSCFSFLNLRPMLQPPLQVWLKKMCSHSTTQFLNFFVSRSVLSLSWCVLFAEVKGELKKVKEKHFNQLRRG